MSSGLLLVAHDDVAHVGLPAVRAGHVPAAEPLLQRALVSGDERGGLRRLRAGGIGKDRPDQHAGHTARAGGDVALRAIELGALERRTLGLLLVEDVEDRALLRVERYELERPFPRAPGRRRRRR